MPLLRVCDERQGSALENDSAVGWPGCETAWRLPLVGAEEGRHEWPAKPYPSLPILTLVQGRGLKLKVIKVRSRFTNSVIRR